MAVAGFIIGIVALSLNVLGIIFYILVAVLAAANQGRGF